eukprot:g45999.t1
MKRQKKTPQGGSLFTAFYTSLLMAVTCKDRWKVECQVRPVKSGDGHESRPKLGEQLLTSIIGSPDLVSFSGHADQPANEYCLLERWWQKHQKLPVIGIPFHQSQNGSQ